MQAGRGVEARKLEVGSARRVAGLQGTGLRDMCVKSLYTGPPVEEMFPQTRERPWPRHAWTEKTCAPTRRSKFLFQSECMTPFLGTGILPICSFTRVTTPGTRNGNV